MKIREVDENKKQFISLLLLADEQENMVDRYLEKGTMYVLEDGDVKAECVVTGRIVIARRRSRRGNLAVLGWIIGYSRRKRNCLPEIAASGGAAVDQWPSAVDFIPAVCYNLPILFWRW